MKPRLRDLGVTIGDLPTGLHNAITDVPGVWVGHETVIRDNPTVVRSGVTMIVPREGGIWSDFAYCGVAVLNGNGEMTGIPWMDESGMLGTPIGLTNTHQVGMVRDSLVKHLAANDLERSFFLPVAAETDDSHLNDSDSFPLTEAGALRALASAGPGPVTEGNVGGGTGMICHEFKGGIGTASRSVETAGETYTVGVLVQANYGVRGDLRIDGFPVGRRIDTDIVPSAWDGEDQRESDGSIIVIIATDAPLVADQCRRLAKRATVGLARAGGYGHDSSGDIFLAFATGNHLPVGEAIHDVRTLHHDQMSPLIRATADAVEESILNALCAAETMTGRNGRTAHEMPLDLVRELLADWT
ncbi:MAG: P1 family peptidase [Actinomycetota bacterium]|nr:P1 family peptidase [Actinomycetota bacterium]